METNSRKIFRVVWEQRKQIQCQQPCCRDLPNWDKQVDPTWYEDYKKAVKSEGRVYDLAYQHIEVRNVQIEYAEITDWHVYNEWEHKEDAK